MTQIGGLGIDGEMAKQFQRILTKQGVQFKLGTKVLGAQKSGGKVTVNVENVKDSTKKEEVLDLEILLDYSNHFLTVY